MDDPVIPEVIRGAGPSIIIRTDSGTGAYKAGTVAEVQEMLGLLPTITADPFDVELYEGQTATFEATATTPFGTITYHVQRLAQGVGDPIDITSGVSGSYTTGVLTVADNDGDQYRIGASNGLGSTAWSDWATANVLASPTLRYGAGSPATKASTAVLNQVWLQFLPCHQTGVLTGFSAYFKNIGTYKLKVMRFNTSTHRWDEVYTSPSNITSAVGVNNLTSADFGTIMMQPRDLVGVFCVTAQLAYEAVAGVGAYNLTKVGDTTPTGNVLVANSLTQRDFQMNYTVLGLPNPSATLISETFDDTTIPWDWYEYGTAWTFSSGKATNGAAGLTHGLYYRWALGHLSQWTMTTNFTLDTAGARLVWKTNNNSQTTFGTGCEINQSTGNMVIYIADAAAQTLTVESTNATGISFSTGTEYRLTVTKSHRTMTFTVDNPAVPAETYTLTKDNEDATAASTPFGLGYGQHGWIGLGGTVSVLGCSLTVPTATPDVLFVGDSIVAGSQVTASSLTYPRRVATALNYVIQTSAQGGATSIHMPKRFMSELAFIRPRHIVQAIGTNDIGDPSGWQTRMTSMRDFASGISNYVTPSIIPRNSSTVPEVTLNPFIRANWGTDGADFDYVMTTGGTGLGADLIAEYFAADMLHPDSEGHAVLAIEVAPTIAP